MNHEAVGDEIIRLIGGTENVIGLNHCATRLRFNLKDEETAKTEEIKKIKGVISVVRSNNQYMVVIGGEVIPVYNAIMQKYHLGGAGEVKGESPVASQKGGKAILKNVMDYISGSMIQMLPMIVGSGLLYALLTIANVMLGVEKTDVTYQVFYSMANGAFYFIPIFVAFSASKKLGCNPFMAGLISAFLLHPSFTGLVGGEAETVLFGIPFVALSYNSNIVPALLGTYIYSKVEKFTNKYLPGTLRTVFGPLLCLLIMLPLMVFIIGPVGYEIGAMLVNLILLVQTHAGWLGAGLLGAAMFPLVMVGAHTLIAPTLIQLLATQGYDTFIRPTMTVAMFSAVGCMLAVMVKTKNKEFRKAAGGMLFSQILGISEPGLYGLLIPLKRPFIATIIGGFIGGVIANLIGVKAYGFGFNGIFGWLVAGDTMPAIIIASLITTVIGFVLCWFMGFDDSQLDE